MKGIATLLLLAAAALPMGCTDPGAGAEGRGSAATSAAPDGGPVEPARDGGPVDAVTPADERASTPASSPADPSSQADPTSQADLERARALAAGFAPTPLIDISAGAYRPLYPGRDEPEKLPVEAFRLERHPVTNAQFLAFVAANPRWRRSQVPALFADGNYLAAWPSDLAHPPGQGDAPVTQVSWFAARAYADWAGRRLPTLAEWEYVAAASATSAFGRDEEGYNQLILNWYAQPTPEALPPVEANPANFYGVHDLHGLVWEWVDDYNSALVTGESRGDAGLERTLFCGSGSIGSADPSDYAAFMRFAFRSSLEGGYTVKNLGFRCAADAAPEASR